MLVQFYKLEILKDEHSMGSQGQSRAEYCEQKDCLRVSQVLTPTDSGDFIISRLPRLSEPPKAGFLVVCHYRMTISILKIFLHDKITSKLRKKQPSYIILLIKILLKMVVL